ncbi:MAG: hypothetical protein ACLRWQ_12410 [Flavonifractor plautii]
MDFDTGVITDDLTTGKTYQAEPVPALHSGHHRQAAACSTP